MRIVRTSPRPNTDLCSLCPQALGVVVIGAVALVAVTQEHFRRLHSGSQSAVMGLAEGVGGRSDNGGLVGLSLTYALPIVGELLIFVCATPPTGRWNAETVRYLFLRYLERCAISLLGTITKKVELF